MNGRTVFSTKSLRFGLENQVAQNMEPDLSMTER